MTEARTEQPFVAVVGSANLDQTAVVDELPTAGQTLLATAYAEGTGGKGLNQAIAAAGSVRVALVAAVGTDPAADDLLGAARSRGIDVSQVVAVDGASGRALIAVDGRGENQIVVVPGATAHLSADDVRRGLDRLRPSVVLVQSEIPPEAERAALAWAAAAGARVVWNRSPVRSTPRDLLRVADPLVVNEDEAAALAAEQGLAVDDLATLCRSVVVTRGSAGATWRDAGGAGHVPAPVPAEVVDTTGAGDQAAGVLAAALARGSSLEEAVGAAVADASRVVGLPRSAR